MRKGNLLDLAAQLGDQLERRVEDLRDTRLDSLRLWTELARHPEPQAAQIGALRQRDLLREAQRRRVTRILADEVTEEQRGVGHRPRERAALVE